MHTAPLRLVALRLVAVLLLATAFVGAGCDGDGPSGPDTDAATVQFGSAGAGVVPTDSTVEVPVTLSNPQGGAVSVEVLFAATASSAQLTDLGYAAGDVTEVGDAQAYVVETVSFPAGTEDGATQTVTFDIAAADISGGPVAAELALQNLTGNAELGSPREFSLNIGPSPIAEARQRGVGATVTVAGTVTRAYGAYARLQDASGATGASALVIRQAGGGLTDQFQDDVTGGTIQPGTRLRLTGTLTAFGGVLQINGDDLANYTVVEQGPVPEPQDVTLDDLATGGEDYESELVRVEGLTFPDASGSFSNGTSYTVADGDGATLTFRVQNANETALGGASIPAEAFTYTGVVGEFGDSYQLIPVRPSDLGSSDGGGGGGGGGAVVTIAEARAEDIDAEVTVRGLVTRVSGSNVYLQDETAAINVFDEDVASGVAPGDEVQLTGAIDVYNELQEIVDVGTDGYEVLSMGNDLPDAQPLTLDAIAADGEAYESELVTVEGLTFDESGTFEGSTNYTVSDESGSLTFRVPGGSALEGEAIPDGDATFTGVVGQFRDDYQLMGLAPDELTSDGGGPGVISIAEARQEPNGTTVTVEGIVTRRDGSNVFIQDETDGAASGIIVRDGDLADAVEAGTVARGDRIRATGGLAAFNGLTQISDDVTYEVAEEDAGLPDAQAVTLTDLLDDGEAYESELIRVEGLTVDADEATFPSGSNLTVTDGTDTFPLRIQSSSFYAGEPIPEGSFTFEGLLGQFNGEGFGARQPDEGYQLTPLDEGDLFE